MITLNWLHHEIYAKISIYLSIYLSRERERERERESGEDKLISIFSNLFCFNFFKILFLFFTIITPFRVPSMGRMELFNFFKQMAAIELNC